MKGQTGFEATQHSASNHFWSGIAHRVAHWYTLHQEREALARMSDDALKDLGMSRADIQQEAELPFWKDPMKH